MKEISGWVEIYDMLNELTAQYLESAKRHGIPDEVANEVAIAITKETFATFMGAVQIQAIVDAKSKVELNDLFTGGRHA